jgi:hypothetical protein
MRAHVPAPERARAPYRIVSCFVCAQAGAVCEALLAQQPAVSAADYDAALHVAKLACALAERNIAVGHAPPTPSALPHPPGLRPSRRPPPRCGPHTAAHRSTEPRLTARCSPVHSASARLARACCAQHRIGRQGRLVRPARDAPCAALCSHARCVGDADGQAAARLPRAPCTRELGEAARRGVEYSRVNGTREYSL